MNKIEVILKDWFDLRTRDTDFSYKIKKEGDILVIDETDGSCGEVSEINLVTGKCSGNIPKEVEELIRNRLMITEDAE